MDTHSNKLGDGWWTQDDDGSITSLESLYQDKPKNINSMWIYKIYSESVIEVILLTFRFMEGYHK